MTTRGGEDCHCPTWQLPGLIQREQGQSSGRPRNLPVMWLFLCGEMADARVLYMAWLIPKLSVKKFHFSKLEVLTTLLYGNKQASLILIDTKLLTSGLFFTFQKYLRTPKNFYLHRLYI